MDLQFSFVVPVYNRPGEIRELLESLALQNFDNAFEVVIVEDGSDLPSDAVVDEYRHKLSISYFSKPNTGPGDSRNYGMERASGNYLLLVDSDCILPEDYLANVYKGLQQEYVDCFGGPDAAHPSFNELQKAISFVMTSPLTTGGIRGNKIGAKGFQPRSFNMGISKEAFKASEGFGDIHPGEDPDLSLRLISLGYTTRLIQEARVFHKRRINFTSFKRQVHKFGLARPILNRWHPGTSKLTYWFPTLFCLGILASLLLLVFGSGYWRWLPGAFCLFYFLLVGIGATMTYRRPGVGLKAMAALLVQFYGYGTGFLKSTLLLTFSRKKPEQLMPQLFFRN